MLKLVGGHAPVHLLKTVNNEEMQQRVSFRWDEFYVSEDGLMSRNGQQQDVRHLFSLPSHKLGWEAPLGSDQAEKNAKSFIKLLKKCGCQPTYENVAWARNLADFWFDASSEALRAYYRLRISCVDKLSWAVVLLMTTVYRPAGEFDPVAMRSIMFLDSVLSSIASTCGVQKLTKY